MSFIVFLASCNPDTEVASLQHDESGRQLQVRLMEIYGSPSALQMPGSEEWNTIPADPKNPLEPVKVTLGKLLFHETGLGTAFRRPEGAKTYSCASCHHAAAGFQSGILQGIGEGGSNFGLFGEGRIRRDTYPDEDIDVQPIRSPSILNTAYQETMLWNGQFGSVGINAGTVPSWTTGTPKELNFLGFEGLETQAIAGVGVHRLRVDENFVREYPQYRVLFDSVFGSIPEDSRYTAQNAGLAIAAYERTVLANESPFQHWLRGDTNAMTEEEKNGALVFFGKGKCFECHTGPGLNGMSFHALGMSDFDPERILGEVDDVAREGRGGFTGNENELYAFKTPTIYNLRGLRFFGHGGSFSSVEEVIRYKNLGIPQNESVEERFLSPLFVPLELEESEIAQLTRFIEDALYDPLLVRYTPVSLPSGLCFPVADPNSLPELGCN